MQPANGRPSADACGRIDRDAISAAAASIGPHAETHFSKLRDSQNCSTRNLHFGLVVPTITRGTKDWEFGGSYLP